MKKQTIKNFEDILNTKHELKVSQAREYWEQEFEAFKLGVLIENARKKSTKGLSNDFERKT
jgi:hypothetical protein